VSRFLETLDVLGIDGPSAQLFGEAKALLLRAGTRLADADLLIAAIAVTRDAVLITGNIRRFGRFPGLRCENWIR
jgi:tRNA(fMet)-specific endonuclease VapC